MRRLAIPVRLAVAAAEVAVARHERSDLQDSRTAHKVTVLRKMDLELLEPCCRGFFGFKIGMLCNHVGWLLRADQQWAAVSFRNKSCLRGNYRTGVNTTRMLTGTPFPG